MGESGMVIAYDVRCPAHGEDRYFIAQRTRQYHKTKAHDEYWAVKRALENYRVEGFYTPRTEPLDEDKALKELGF